VSLREERDVLAGGVVGGEALGVWRGYLPSCDDEEPRFRIEFRGCFRFLRVQQPADNVPFCWYGL
jgi:hypothetical protein